MFGQIEKSFCHFIFPLHFPTHTHTSKHWPGHYSSHFITHTKKEKCPKWVKENKKKQKKNSVHFCSIHYFMHRFRNLLKFHGIIRMETIFRSLSHIENIHCLFPLSISPLSLSPILWKYENIYSYVRVYKYDNRLCYILIHRQSSLVPFQWMHTYLYNRENIWCASRICGSTEVFDGFSYPQINVRIKTHMKRKNTMWI